MSLTPQITLTANLQDFTGALVGSVGNPAKLRICLAGYGAVPPVVAGSAVIAKPGPFDIYSTNGTFTTQIWGNDVITPSGTYYSITILDGDDNVVQCGAYLLTGSGTQDLSTLTPITPGGLTPLFPYLALLACTGAYPGTMYTAPGTVIGVAYNGLFMLPGLSSPHLSYTLNFSKTVITLNFTTSASPTGGGISALCIVP